MTTKQQTALLKDRLGGWQNFEPGCLRTIFNKVLEQLNNNSCNNQWKKGRPDYAKIIQNRNLVKYNN